VRGRWGRRKADGDVGVPRRSDVRSSDGGEPQAVEILFGLRVVIGIIARDGGTTCPWNRSALARAGSEGGWE